MTVSAGQFHQTAEALCHYGRILYSRDWSPATSSNYSARLDEHLCALTSSGKHKGELTVDDILVVDQHGQPFALEGVSCSGKPSAETLLHSRIYQQYPEAGAVLHTHSASSVLVSMLCKEPVLTLQGWELQKAIAGQRSHLDVLEIPVVDNDQDMPTLLAALEPRLKPETRVYLIRGHGIYTWGKDLAECFRHLEAMEHLLAYQLELRKMQQS